jgi:hypothetical protein
MMKRDVIDAMPGVFLSENTSVLVLLLVEPYSGLASVSSYLTEYKGWIGRPTKDSPILLMDNEDDAS